MHSALAEAHSPVATTKDRRLRLIWKDPKTGRYSHVGWLEALADGRYCFRYTPEAVDIDGFTYVSQYPDPSQTYVSEVLPAFFANRIMNRRRPSYDQYVGWLGLDPDALPVEIMARTGEAGLLTFTSSSRISIFARVVAKDDSLSPACVMSFQDWSCLVTSVQDRSWH